MTDKNRNTNTMPKQETTKTRAAKSHSAQLSCSTKYYVEYKYGNDKDNPYQWNREEREYDEYDDAINRAEELATLPGIDLVPRVLEVMTETTEYYL